MNPVYTTVDGPSVSVNGPRTTPLRILMVSHLPWTRELGAAKVQVELADELRELGHHVDAFCVTDAFREPAGGRVASHARYQLFPWRARAHVRGVASEYDVIDALQSSLPFSKRSLGFDGLLVTRSTGLSSLYDEWLRIQRERWPDTKNGRALGRLLRRQKSAVGRRRCRSSLDHADLISLLNRHELRHVREKMASGERAVLLQHGLSRDRFGAFDTSRERAEIRLRNREVVFVGQWIPRKGARELGDIVARVMRRVPGVRFSFLGTGCSEQDVRRQLGVGADEAIRVVPRFASEDLPDLLSGATVGCLPSHLEGFPFSILEQLAAGLPTVAYDVPGPGETLELVDPTLLVPESDTRAFAGRIVDVVERNEAEYRALSDHSVAVAKRFRWDQIAAETADVYAAWLEKLRTSSQLGPSSSS